VAGSWSRSFSHSGKDKPFVRDVAAALEAGGEIKVWLEKRVLKIADGQVAD
jgi:hypothetical protein